MGFKASRPRSGMSGSSQSALWCCWCSCSPQPGTTCGWPDRDCSTAFYSVTGLRWLVLVTVAVSFALVLLQGTRSALALPVTFSVFVWVPRRTHIAVDDLPPHPDLVAGCRALYDQTAASYVALASGLLLTYGGYRTLREEEESLTRSATGLIGDGQPRPTGADWRPTRPCPYSLEWSRCRPRAGPPRCPFGEARTRRGRGRADGR